MSMVTEGSIDAALPQKIGKAVSQVSRPAATVGAGPKKNKPAVQKKPKSKKKVRK